MKNFLIGFAVWFLFAFAPQFVISGINGIRFRIARKKAKHCDKWIFEKKEGRK